MVPKLTIITPSFNQAAFLRKTLDSVLDQSYPNLEYLVVDGGSTDGSVDILRSYDSRLSWWVSEADRGQTDALNKALRRASGEIVAYINSDDWYLPGAFDTVIEAYERHPETQWVVGACRFIYPDGSLRTVWRPASPLGLRPTWVLAPWGVPQAATFWRREVFERYGLFREDMHYAFDTEYGLRLALNGVMPAFVEQELAVRLVHPEAKSADRSRWVAEQARFPKLFKGLLSPRERVEMVVIRVAGRLGWFRFMEAIHPFTSRVRTRLGAG